MKKLLTYVLIIVVTTFIISTAALYFVNAGLKKQQNDSFYTLNHIFYNNDNHDLLMIGNSRCKNNLNPKVIDSICSTNAFNTGNYNFTIIEYKLILEIYLTSGHPKPKYVAVTLDNNVLNTDVDFYFPQQFLPYIQNNIIYNSLHEYSDDYFTVRYLPFVGITRYNDYMKYLALKAFRDPSPTGKNFYKGFLPMTGGHAQREANLKNAKLEPTDKGIQLLEEFFALSKQNSIKVFVILPPFYQDINSGSDARLSQSFYDAVSPVFAKYDNIKVYDMSNAPINYREELFFDKGHLNAAGAEEFSKLISDSLKIYALN